MQLSQFRFVFGRMFVLAFSGVFLAMALFSSAFAVTSDANFTLTVGSVNLTVISGSVWNSFTVNTNGTLSLTLDPGERVTLQSSDKYIIEHSFPSSHVSQQCASTYYELIITGVTASSVTYTVTPTTSVCAASGSSGGSSSSSSSSSVSTSTTARTTVTTPPPVVEPEPEAEPEVEAEPEEIEEVEMVLPEPVLASFQLNKAKSVEIAPGVSHEVFVFLATANRAKIILQSEPMTLLLMNSVDVTVDTDGDGEKDLRLTYNGFDAGGNPQIEFQSLILVPAPETSAQEPVVEPVAEEEPVGEPEEELLPSEELGTEEAEKKVEEPAKPVTPPGFVKKEELAPELSLSEVEERVVEVFRDIVDNAAQTQHWAAKAVAAVVQRNIMMGSDKEVTEKAADGSIVTRTVRQFDPNRNTLRCEMAAIALRFLGEDPDMSVTSTPFFDVDPDLWCIPHIKRVAELGIMTGYDRSDGVKVFGPTNSVKRSEALKIILESAKISLLDASEVSKGLFPDVKADAWYAVYIATGVRNGLVKGYQDGMFRPGQDVTRGEMAALIARTLDYLARR